MSEITGFETAPQAAWKLWKALWRENGWRFLGGAIVGNVLAEVVRRVIQ